MSKAGLEGMQLATADIITVAKSLSADEWALPSAAEGWSVHDVVAHAGNLLTVVMQAVAGELVTPDGMGIEELNDVQVAEAKEKTPEELIEFLESQLAKAVPVFTPLQDEPYYSMEAALLDLGIYQLHAVVDMFTFDFTTHLRFDILAPRGPVTRNMEPLGEAVLGSAISWLLGGIPKMQKDLGAHLDGPVGLVLTGPAATSVVFSPVDGGIVITDMDKESSFPLAATVSSPTSDFLAWSTTRLPWRESVAIRGDGIVAGHFFDALNLT
jgi:uncharacterized protein (TIGR03083 family)